MSVSNTKIGVGVFIVDPWGCEVGKMGIEFGEITKGATASTARWGVSERVTVTDKQWWQREGESE